MASTPRADADYLAEHDKRHQASGLFCDHGQRVKNAREPRLCVDAAQRQGTTDASEHATNELAVNDELCILRVVAVSPALGSIQPFRRLVDADHCEVRVQLGVRRERVGSDSASLDHKCEVVRVLEQPSHEAAIVCVPWWESRGELNTRYARQSQMRAHVRAHTHLSIV